MKVKKRKRINKDEIKILSECFGIIFHEKKEGIAENLELKTVRKIADKKMNHLFQMLGIKEVEDHEFYVVDKNNGILSGSLIAKNSSYYMKLQYKFDEVFPSIEIRNENMQSMYRYIDDYQKDTVRLQQKFFQYQTSKLLLVITNDENEEKNIKTVSIAIRSSKGVSQIVYQDKIDSQNIGISAVEEVLKALEPLENVEDIFDQIIKLLPKNIEKYWNVTINVDTNKDRLYKEIQNGIEIQSIVIINGQKIDISPLSRKVTE